MRRKKRVKRLCFFQFEISGAKLLKQKKILLCVCEILC
jgi:hypothetical protein